MKVSFIIITARKDFPYVGRPDLHLFEPTLESFKRQSMKDFEFIIVDVLYDKRKDYFEGMDLPFKVKHVPALPNIWIENGFPGVCRQYNKGIIHADGELLFFAGDGNMVAPDFMEKLWSRYQEGYFPLAWYQYDLTNQKNTDFGGGKNDVSPVSYDICGYSGEKVFIEYRYYQLFEDNNLDVAPAPWLWWFGCSSASLDAMLKINGFDQRFDGDKMLMDCDVGSRLDLVGHHSRFAMFRDIYLARCTMKPGYGFSGTTDSIGNNVTIKCSFALLWFSRFFNKFRANCYKLENSDIEWIKRVFCGGVCPRREFCAENHPWQYPFEHKEGYVSHGSLKKWWKFWREHQGLVDLTEERKLRKDGSKYQEGTFVGKS